MDCEGKLIKCRTGGIPDDTALAGADFLSPLLHIAEILIKLLPQCKVRCWGTRCASVCVCGVCGEERERERDRRERESVCVLCVRRKREEEREVLCVCAM